MSLTVRLASPDDAGWIADIYAPYVRDTVISFELTPPSAEEMSKRIETTLQIYPWLVAEEAGQPLGYAYASQHRSRAAYQWSCDVSVYVAPAAQGRKVGTRLYEQLLDMLAQNAAPLACNTRHRSLWIFEPKFLSQAEKARHRRYVRT